MKTHASALARLRAPTGLQRTRVWRGANLPMLLSLAQSPSGPIHLVTGEPAPAAPAILPLWLGLTIIGVIVFLALVAWVALARLAEMDKDPAEYAFRLLARRL